MTARVLEVGLAAEESRAEGFARASLAKDGEVLLLRPGSGRAFIQREISYKNI